MTTRHSKPTQYLASLGVPLILDLVPCAVSAEDCSVMIVHGWTDDCGRDPAGNRACGTELGCMFDLQLHLQGNLDLPMQLEQVECFSATRDPDDCSKKEDYRDRGGYEAIYQKGAVSAAQLKVEVDKFRARPENLFKEICIVAHSFGGLVSRYYLEQLGGTTSSTSS